MIKQRFQQRPYPSTALFFLCTNKCVRQLHQNSWQWCSFENCFELHSPNCRWLRNFLQVWVSGAKRVETMNLESQRITELEVWEAPRSWSQYSLFYSMWLTGPEEINDLPKITSKLWQRKVQMLLQVRDPLLGSEPALFCLCWLMGWPLVN